MKKRAEKKGRTKEEFQIGDEVLIKIEIRTSKKESKRQKAIDPLFHSTPAIIVQKSNNQTYKLQMKDGSVLPHGDRFYQAEWLKFAAGWPEKRKDAGKSTCLNF